MMVTKGLPPKVDLNAGVGPISTEAKLLVDGVERQSIPIALAAGEVRNYTQSVLDLTEGTHNITLWVEPVAGELVTVNNRWSILKTYSRPDLLFSSVFLPPLQLGSNLISYAVFNDGSVAAYNVHSVMLVNGTQVAHQLYEEVRPKRWAGWPITWTVPCIGTYNITLYVYPVPAESNLANNQRVFWMYMRDLDIQNIKLVNATLGGRGYVAKRGLTL